MTVDGSELQSTHIVSDNSVNKILIFQQLHQEPFSDRFDASWDEC